MANMQILQNSSGLLLNLFTQNFQYQHPGKIAIKEVRQNFLKYHTNPTDGLGYKLWVWNEQPEDSGSTAFG